MRFIVIYPGEHFQAHREMSSSQGDRFHAPGDINFILLGRSISYSWGDQFQAQRDNDLNLRGDQFKAPGEHNLADPWAMVLSIFPIFHFSYMFADTGI